MLNLTKRAQGFSERCTFTEQGFKDDSGPKDS